ncbi:MAG: hemoglobin/transferrin/lactoferrin receptor protein, partial [Bacteroidia bacterium]
MDMKSTTYYMIFPVLLCLMRSASAGGEGATSGDLLIDLDTFVVQATRSTERVFDLPYAVDVVDQETMFRNSVRSLPEALSETPGVLVQKTANGHGSPFIRGFTGYRTLTMVDGVRYNNSVYRDGPNEYFSLIDFKTLDQIELLLGPSSTLFGSDAIGGTVNLRSKASGYLYEELGLEFIHGSQSYRYSSGEDSHITRTEFDLGVGAAWGLFVGYSWKQFGEVDAADVGRQQKTNYDEWSWDARFDMSLSDQWTLALAHQYLEQDGVWRTHSTIYGLSYSGTKVGSDLRRFKDQSRELNYAKLVGEELDGGIDRVVLTLSYQRWDEDGDRIKSDSSRIVDGFDSHMYGADVQFESATEIGDFLYGVDLYRDEVDSRRVDYSADGSVDEVRIQGPVGDDSTYDIAGCYIRGEFALADRLTLLFGGRYTFVSADIGQYENPETGEVASFDDSWDNFVSSIRLSYLAGAGDQFNLWAGVSQSFRAPNIADLSRLGKSRSSETEVAATDLDPEAFLTYELGL